MTHIMMLAEKKRIDSYRTHRKEPAEQRREYNRKWRQKHPQYSKQEKWQEYQKKYRTEHAEERKEFCRIWRQKHPEYKEMRREKLRVQRRNAGPDDPARKRHRLTQTKWKEKNLDRIAIYNEMNNHKRKYPLGKNCEFCEEKESLVRHHPDYKYPEIYVTCCNLCHGAIHYFTIDESQTQLL